MMITEVMKISEPPYTNRGVTRQKEDLTALIDWCQITVKGVDVFIIIEDILRIPLSFMELHGKEKGIAGHELIARFDNIKILKPTGNAQYEGFQILMSGSGCRNYENFLMMNKETWFDFLERVCRYPVNFPRIDLAIDDTKPYLSTRKRLYPTYPPWEELMQDVGKIKLTMNPEKKTLERTWQWLNVAVSPSLKLMDKIGKLDNRDYIRQLIERGQMNEEQQRIYEDYKKSFLLREEERRIFDRTYTEHDTDKESPYSE